MRSHHRIPINSHKIAEVYHLVDGYKSIFVGYDLFSSTSLTNTSWADLDFGIDFSARLGRLEVVRVPYIEANGVSLILPKRSLHGGQEVLEVMIMLRRDDMDTLDQVWYLR